MAQTNQEEAALSSNYRAFISYSHADTEIVRKLHSQLETYRLPKGLGEITSQNAGPQTTSTRDLGKIFRDREYLSVAQDLSASVKSALERSEVLVVVCSPQAKASQWVEREIEYFRSLHKDRPILAALVEGEPKDAFPEALIEGGVEPLAADLRKHGDGWKLGFLKLVAGIVGVSLDALIQRDSQRQLTRVMAVTGVVGVFALCMMAMAFVAIQARNEAQFHQREAEGLITYMMGELRTELKGVGRLDVMEGVNDRTLQYYSNQGDLANLSPDSIEQRALILHSQGEDLELAGDLEGAQAKFLEAHRDTEELLRREPTDLDRIYAHSQSSYWVGYVAYLEKNWSQTEVYWTIYRDLTTRLLASDRTKIDWLKEAGFAEGNLCTLEFDRHGDMANALNRCTTALELFQEIHVLEPDEPEHLINIANRYVWLGDIFGRTGDLSEERAARLAGEKHAEMLLERDPSNRDWQDLWLGGQISLAKDELEAGETAAAQVRLSKAKKVAEELVRAEPNKQYSRAKLEKIISMIRG